MSLKSLVFSSGFGKSGLVLLVQTKVGLELEQSPRFIILDTSLDLNYVYLLVMVEPISGSSAKTSWTKKRRTYLLMMTTLKN